jgi:hypothetical protein
MSVTLSIRAKRLTLRARVLHLPVAAFAALCGPGSDFGTLHVVSAVNGWVFDASESSGAMRFTQETLNMCCAGAQCVGFRKVLVVTPAERLVNALTRKEACHEALR